MRTLNPISRATSASSRANATSFSTISKDRSPGPMLSRSSPTTSLNAGRDCSSSSSARVTREIAPARASGPSSRAGAGWANVWGRYSVKVLPRPAEQAGDLATDGEAQSGAAVLAARAAVRLLERLEDDLLLLERDADAGIGDREGEDRLRLAQVLAVASRLGAHRPDLEGYAAPPRELEGVGEEILDDLLQPLGVRDHGSRFCRIEPHRELESLRLRDVSEGALHVAAQIYQAQLADVDRDGPGLDLR